MSEIYNLPDDFFNGNPAETGCYFYQTKKSSEKNKVIFSQNLLCLLLEGEKTLYYEDTLTKISKATFFLLPKGNVLMSEKISEIKKYESILIFFSDDFLNDFIIRNNITVPKKTNKSNTTPTKDEFIRNFEASLLLLKQTIAKDEKLCSIKTEEILLYLYRKFQNTMLNFLQNALTGNSNFTFKKLIKNNLYQNLSVKELAFLSNMSVSSFKRKFSEIYQTSPRKYFIKERMEKAKRELLNHKKPSDFFYDLGYENLSSFSNEFKKYFGASPKFFCKKMNV
ncbi:MAG: AraC family transcriptional regulator [Flavobacteriaceae bacterium]|jgi:AraC-like DNA-binding protein|nr:AraC family transcriptional regulator [Flavobacteriaceae bacterium]